MRTTPQHSETNPKVAMHLDNFPPELRDRHSGVCSQCEEWPGATQPATGPDAARLFLRALYGNLPEGYWFTIWTVDASERKHTEWFTDPEQAADYVTRECVGKDTYCSLAIADRKGEPWQRISGKLDPDIDNQVLAVGLVALGADIDIAGPGHTDAKRYPPTQAAALKVVDAVPLRAMFTNHSGGGVQSWWPFREPWLFTDDNERRDAQIIVRGWIATVQAKAAALGFDIDPTNDLARVFRVPGSANCKLSEHRPVTILRHDEGAQYNPPGDFDKFFPDDFDWQPDDDAASDGITTVALALPPDAEPMLRQRFDELLRRDGPLRGQWQRTAERKDKSASGYAAGVARCLACEHRWQPSELAWAIRHFYTVQATRPDDHRLHPLKLMLTVRYGVTQAAANREELEDRAAGAPDKQALADAVKALIAEVQQQHEDTPIWAAVLTLARLKRAEYAKVKRQLKDTLRERLNLNDLDHAVCEARTEIQRATSRGDESHPVIYLGGQLRDRMRDATAALLEANTPPFSFVRGGKLTQLRHDEHGAALLGEVNADELRHRLATVATFVKRTRGGEVDANVPDDLARVVLAAPSFNEYPPIIGVSESPIIRPDGSIVTVPGYDATTQMLYAPHPSLRLPSIPDAPTGGQRDAAIDLLREAIGDFPFVDASSRANALAMILTPILRPAINGHVPVAIADSPQAGSGKTMLAEVFGIVSTGRPTALFSAPGFEDEWRKRLTSALLDGPSIICIDNVEGQLKSPSLAACVTATVWKDRILGRTQNIELPQRSCFLLTGNNVVLAGDLPRRCFHTRIDAETVRPWGRDGFQHPELIPWVAEHRGQLLGAALTLIRSWYTDGKPRAEVPAFGSFEEWSRTIGGILAHAGVTGFLGNLADLWERSDNETAEWVVFLSMLRDIFGEEAVMVGDICNAATRSTSSLLTGISPVLAAFPAQALGRLGEPDRQRLGIACRTVDGKRFPFITEEGEKSIRIAHAGADLHSKVGLWRVIVE